MKTGVIIITGTSRGIGHFLTQRYLSNGWVVAGCSRGDSIFDHDRYHHFQLDVGDEEAVTKMVRSVYSEFGQVDALLNNAGIASMNAALLTPGSTIESVFRTNTFGAFYFAREVAKLMIRKKNGRIVFFTTIARPLQLEGEMVYAASKAAVESITRILARELGEDGVTVNAVGPTPIETDLIKGIPIDKLDQLLEKQAIKRMGKFEDVYNVVDFFLSEKSDYLTGQVVYLGGVGN